MLIFAEGRKTLEARERINNKLYSHITPSTRLEPGATVMRGERSHRYATHAFLIHDISGTYLDRDPCAILQ
jgi:hypothetical protein